MSDQPGPSPITSPITSPLHARHEALGARLSEFGGWLMPLEYAAGTVREHTAVREAVGLFDVSHLGKVAVRGPGAVALVDSCLTADLGRIGAGQAQYSLCCDDATGGIVDDLIAYRRADDDVLLVPNAANSAEVARRLRTAAAERAPEVEVLDLHRDLVVLAVQGPRSDAVLAGVGLPAGHEYLSFVEAVPGAAPGVGEVVVCRTGYTGERGYELLAAAADAEALWDALVAAGEPHGLLPAGLGARDTLRTEMGYALHGQDIGPEVTPLEARLGWAVGWSKPAFWGREVLLAAREAGASRLLRGLVASGRGIPRPHMRVLTAADGLDGAVVGELTSGTFSPTLRRGVGLALLDASVPVGAEVVVDVRGRPEPFTVTTPPFVPSSVREATA
ncbi:glycine cleavage system aminomethyltransferase GcvT [Nocardioides sp. TRM66260-LWL]|uniref:glycine cleavage system aminomethyltransferase GcvT n=1 Tax=Nocardioides sp. TRM66260-LWL TaxID=2874478 RepID=UPI001CC3F879|nr:glycine cleavage system aminomethyltransferase GcvT [Nocardioides sp. TRM66260-LWL]MBZ5733753.1 glycine cleavage system aminomethyltransferase GcvT [Nocardioides sp. TRM66260-LWL]